MSTQLPLQFEFQTHQHFGSFYPGHNEEILNHLKQLFSRQERQIYLWGEQETGKTHLLQACCQVAHKQHKTSFYLSLDNQHLPSSSLLDGLENIDLVCLDNIEQVAGNEEWEQAFLHFYDLHRDNDGYLLVSSSCPPKLLTIEHSDLKNRMNWGLTVQLHPLDEQQQLQALIHKANDLGFEIPLNVGEFLMAHYAHDMPTIWELLGKIDHATLVAKSKLTIPLLKEIMMQESPAQE